MQKIILNENVIFLPLPTPANLRFSSRTSTLSWLRGGGGLYFFLRSSKSVDLVALVTFPSYILGMLCHLIFLTTVHWVQYRLAGRKIKIFYRFTFFSFAYLIYLIPKLIIYFYFLILMTGSASNLTLKLVVLHDELESVKHGVLHDTLVEVSGTQVHFRQFQALLF